MVRAKRSKQSTASQPVEPEQRFAEDRPCPVCGGHSALPQGEGRRCYGFVSADNRWAHCTRAELAGDLPLKEDADTYAHLLPDMQDQAVDAIDAALIRAL